MSGQDHSQSIPDRARLDALFSRLCDERLTQSEFEELDAVLAASAGARRHFRRYMNLHATMHTYLAAAVHSEAAEFEAAEAPGEGAVAPARWHLVPVIPPARRTAIRAQPRPRVNPVFLAAAAAVVFAVGLVALQWLYEVVPVLPGGEGLRYATLTRTTDATWAPGSIVPKPGDTLGRERLALESGSFRIRFERGADVTFTGQAEIEILGDNSVRLLSGKMLAEVPASASGFSVDTGAFQVIDVGTVFGVTIGEEGEVEISVVEGHVELAVRDQPDGESVRIQRLRKWQSVVARPQDLTVKKKRYDVTAYVGMREPEGAAPES